MQPITFADIRRLLELRESTAVNEIPIASVPDRWALYVGESVVLRYQYTVYFLHLLSDCTLEDVPQAGASLVNPKLTDVIFAPSLERLLTRDESRLDDVRHWLRQPRGILSIPQFISQLLQVTLSKYREKLATLRPSYFVEPPVESEAQSKGQLSRPLRAHLAKAAPNLGVGVLLAEAGQGKTHTTLQLAATLTTSIPIYVDSRLWKGSTPEHLTDPWKTITSSMSHFGAPVPWAIDAERDFVSIMLRAGIFSLIFDGFDEYIYWNRGRLDPIETLRLLGALGDDSSSGVLVTSRTSFWESDVAGDFDLDISHTRYRLVPFDRRHAYVFFESRFDGTNQSPARAMELYDTLRSSDGDSAAGFVGRGFVLELIADLVARADALPTLPTGASIARRVMKAICQREQVRQSLPLNSEQQLRALGIFAEAVAAGQPPSSDILQLSVQLAAESIDQESLRNLVGDSSTTLSGQLAQHPLIEWSSLTNEWHIRQEQVYYDLLAEQLLLCRDRDDPILRDFVEKILPDAKLSADIATVVLDQACSAGDTTKVHEILCEAVAKLLSYSRNIPTKASMPEKALATAIAMLAVNRFETLGRPREARCAALLALIPDGSLLGLQFSGSISSMDFSMRTFKDCRFDNVVWINCTFDATTGFDGCRFIGGRLDHCDGFGVASFQNIWADPDASILIKSEQVLAHARIYEPSDLERDINLLIRKLVSPEGFGTRSLEERYLKSGTFSASPHRDAILDAFWRHIIERHTVAGRPGVNVRAEARDALMFYVANGVMSGPLARAHDEVLQNLRLAEERRSEPHGTARPLT